MSCDSINHVLSGVILCECIVIAMFFISFWKRTNDSFFIYLASSFAFFAIERILFQYVGGVHESTPYLYGLRLLGFLCIIVAIMEKNRRRAD